MSRSLASTSVTCQSVKPRSRVAPSGSVMLSKAMPALDRRGDDHVVEATERRAARVEHLEIDVARAAAAEAGSAMRATLVFSARRSTPPRRRTAPGPARELPSSTLCCESSAVSEASIGKRVGAAVAVVDGARQRHRAERDGRARRPPPPGRRQSTRKCSARCRPSRAWWRGCGRSSPPAARSWLRGEEGGLDAQRFDEAAEVAQHQRDAAGQGGAVPDDEVGRRRRSAWSATYSCARGSGPARSCSGYCSSRPRRRPR